MRREIPEEWKQLAARKGIPGSANGIATAAGIGVSTFTRLVFEGRTSRNTVQAVADALGVTPERVTNLAQITAAGSAGPWVPPVGAHELSGPMREALDRLILVILAETKTTALPSVDELSDRRLKKLWEQWTEDAAADDQPDDPDQ